jgi:S1-C subfamily serine protease
MNAGDRGYIVVFVSPGGAADAAGIQKGDIVTAIEGRPAISAQLSDARELLRTTPQGSMVTLETLHNGETRTIKLVLQNRL